MAFSPATFSSSSGSGWAASTAAATGSTGSTSAKVLVTFAVAFIPGMSMSGISISSGISTTVALTSTVEFAAVLDEQAPQDSRHRPNGTLNGHAPRAVTSAQE